jgi:hypothetical protein
MSDESTEGDGDLDSPGYGEDHDGSFSADVGDEQELLDHLQGDHRESDGPGRSAPDWSGLTEPERELADERNRIRELETTRDRLERFAGDGELGGGRGTGSPADRDALAVIEAAERFGVDEDDEQAQRELDAISEALAIHAERPPKPENVYEFYGIVSGQTTKGTNVILTIKVPWEWREEVWRAMDTMPFATTIRMTDVGAV